MNYQNVSVANYPEDSQERKHSPEDSTNPILLAIQSVSFLFLLLIFMAIFLLDTLLLRLQYKQKVSRLAASEQ